MIEVMTMAEVRSEVGSLFVDRIAALRNDNVWSEAHQANLDEILDAICYDWFNLMEAPKSGERREAVLTPVPGSVRDVVGGEAPLYYIDSSYGDKLGEREYQTAAGGRIIYFDRILKRPVRCDEVFYPILLSLVSMVSSELLQLVAGMGADSVPLTLAAGAIAFVIEGAKKVLGLYSKEALNNPIDRAVYLIALDHYTDVYSCDDVTTVYGPRDELSGDSICGYFYQLATSKRSSELKKFEPRTRDCTKEALDLIRRDSGRDNEVQSCNRACEHAISRLCGIGYITPIKDKDVTTYRINYKA